MKSFYGDIGTKLRFLISENGLWFLVQNTEAIACDDFDWISSRFHSTTQEENPSKFRWNKQLINKENDWKNCF